MIKSGRFYGRDRKIVLANHNLVTPAYLVEIEEKGNLELDMFISENLTELKSKNLNNFHSL